MAKITIDIDTETKTVSANVNGETLSNINRVWIGTYTDWDDGMPEQELRVELSSTEKVDDVTKTWTICADRIEKSDTDKESEVAKDFLKYLGK